MKSETNHCRECDCTIDECDSEGMVLYLCDECQKEEDDARMWYDQQELAVCHAIHSRIENGED